MTSKQKLELTWLGKDKEIKIEPRILIEDKEKSNCENDPNTENMIIHGAIYLLSDEGSIWISIDDEGHYLKVLCDEIFGSSGH